MQLLKRIELWIILIVVLVGLTFVFRSKPHEEDGSAEPSTAVNTDNAPLKILHCELTRDFGNGRLSIEVRVTNDSPDKLVLQSPKVRLLTEKGREVPSFFLPFQPQPEVPAKSTQDVELRYWLDAADLDGALKLDVNGKTVDVKSSKSFDLNSLKNKDPKTFGPTEW